MTISGSGTNFGSGEGYDYAASAKKYQEPAPPLLDTWGALINQGVEGVTHKAADWIDVETNTQVPVNGNDTPFLGESGSFPKYAPNDLNMSIEQANQKYGLKLSPTFANQIHQSLAEYLARKENQKRTDEAIIGRARPDLGTQLVGGAIGSFADPGEAALNILPITEVLGLVGRASRLGPVARWATRAAQSPVLHNPWVSGVVEGGVMGAASTVPKALMSKTLGQDYTLNDAVMDAGYSAVGGGIIQGGLHLAGKALGVGSPVDPHKGLYQAHNDFANGEAINPTKAVDRQKFEYDATQARRDLTQEILKDSQAAEGDHFQRSGVEPDQGTITKAGSPRELTPGVLDNPEIDRHTSLLEKKLLAVNDPAGFKAELDHFAEGYHANLAKLGDLISLPKDELLRAHPEIHGLQQEILSSVAQVNEMIPTAASQLPTDLPITKQGIFRKDALSKLSASIKALNDLALDKMDDPAKVAVLQKEFDRLRGELKNANQSLAQARTKGSSTADLHSTRIAELAPQVQHAQRLLQSFGQEANAPELSFQTFLDSLGHDASPELTKMLEADPSKLDQPVYRVRKQVFDNVMRRLYDTSEYLKSTDPVNLSPSKFPEDNAILSDVRKELAGLGDKVDPDKVHEELFKRVNQEIADQKKLGIFDESQLKRFDKIEEDFKANVEKTNAIKEGALQAQICALGGVQ